MDKVTEKIAEFIVNTRYSEVPREVIDVAKLHILDTLGCLIAGSCEEIGRIVRAYIKAQGRMGEATLLTQGIATSPAYAAFGNGIVAHVLDYDDYEVPSMAHPSVSVLPAVLALGEKLGASGESCIEAYLAGMEVISQVGRGIAPEHYDRGWHSTGTLGALGAAAASSRLLNLDSEKTKVALGIAASMSSGLRGNFGTMTKSFHAGHASRNGVEAAGLAALGFTAAMDIIEGDLGFCTVFTDGRDFDLAKISDRLGNPFSLFSPGVGRKLYPSCAATHGYLDGLIELASRHDIKPEDVDSVECGIFYRHPKMLIHANPKTGLEGKFSLEFCAALALSQRGATLKDFVDSKVMDPEIQKLIKKVSKAVTDEAGVRGTEVTVALMKVSLIDGTTYSCRVEHKKGSPGNPSSVDEIVHKFEECARLRYTGEQGQRILEAAMDLEKVGNVRELIALFSTGKSDCDESKNY
jgi:2-methylcitrate dehydratase PrpD